MKNALCWRWLRVYFECEVKKGECMTAGAINGILLKRFRYTAPDKREMMKGMTFATPYLELMDTPKKHPMFFEKVYRNTLGNHYGKPYKMVKKDGKLYFEIDGEKYEYE